MAYQEGLETLGDAVTSREVTFSPAFSDTPDIVIPTVENTVDGSPLKITAHVTVKSSTGFTVEFSAATDSVNYQLAWIAGSATALFSAVSEGSRRVSALTAQTTPPVDGDYVLGITTHPKPVTVKLPWSLLYSILARFQAEPPSDPSSAGDANSVAVDGDYFYVRSGSAWGRLALNTSNWSGDDSYKVRKSGLVDLDNGEQIVSVVYDTAFEGDTPHVKFFLENLTGDTILLLYGIITARSLSGFTVTLNSPPDTGNYKMYWEAVQE